LHAHPECTFDWARLVVDLTPTPNARIADMSPREVEDVPVDIETKVGVGLKFSVIGTPVNIQAAPEESRKRTVFFPRVLVAGVGFHKGVWDFFAKAGDYLHVDKELRLLVEAPAGSEIRANAIVRAKVRLRGIGALLPLIARTGASGGELLLSY